MRPPVAKNVVIEIEKSAAVHRKLDLAWLREQLGKASGQIPLSASQVSVMLVDDARMSQLHAAHCGINSTTDVLTFPPSPDDEPAEIGIAICADEAARRVAGFGHAIERELLLYAIHGLLHCAGFDDHDDAGHRAMHAEEDRILELIGVGATFHRPDSDAAAQSEGV